MKRVQKSVNSMGKNISIQIMIALNFYNSAVSINVVQFAYSYSGLILVIAQQQLEVQLVFYVWNFAKRQLLFERVAREPKLSFSAIISFCTY